MQLVGVESQDGLVLSWLPDGLKLEMSKSKVNVLMFASFCINYKRIKDL